MEFAEHALLSNMVFCVDVSQTSNNNARFIPPLNWGHFIHPLTVGTVIRVLFPESTPVWYSVVAVEDGASWLRFVMLYSKFFFWRPRLLLPSVEHCRVGLRWCYDETKRGEIWLMKSTEGQSFPRLPDDEIR